MTTISMKKRNEAIFTLRKINKQYVPFMKAGIQSLIAYRMNFFGFAIGGLIYCFVMYYLWKAVFSSSGSDNFMGFSMVDMTLYLFLSNITSQLTFSSVCDDVGEEIRHGDIAMRLLKPVNTDLSYLANEIGGNYLKFIVSTIPMIIGIEIYRTLTTGDFLFNIGNFALYLLSVILAYLISFRVNLCFGFMAFYVKNLWGMNILKNSIINFLSGMLIPLAFMPEFLRKILEYMPFSSMSYTPVMIYMGKYGTTEIIFRIAIQAVWTILLYALSKLIWFHAVKRLSVQGG